MIASLKRSSLALSKHLGLSHLLARSEWRRRRLLVLCYHGVSLHDEHEWDPGLHISPEQFERRLTLLQRNRCTVLPFAEAIRRLSEDSLPERAVTLTFDDGYYDFMVKAWPVLQRFHYPATVYLTTARVEHNFPIVNLFASYVLWRSRTQVLDGRGVPGLSGRYELRTPAQRERVVREMDQAVQRLAHTAQEKDRIVKELVDRLGLDYEALLASRVLTLMRPDEVKQMASLGVDFQLHTHLHRTPDDADVFVRDVLQNKTRVEALTGTAADHLCYPSGMYRLSYLPGLRRAGIASGTTCDPGIAVRASEPLLLPRFVDTGTITDVEFEGWITGAAACLPRRTKKAYPSIH
jgi:peptidoglycan/xylan/chitin deacetylase (PgdA/CDA1 family)